jgi:hypothetical protein
MEYLHKRKSLTDLVGEPNLFEMIDHWQIYVGQENLNRFLTIFQILSLTKSVPGDIVELGSWKGANLLGISKVIRFLEMEHERKIYSFDSFEGLTNPSKYDEFDTNLYGKYRGNLGVLQEAINLYDFSDTISLEIGLIENTVPRFVLANPNVKLAFIYFDADLYQPAKTMFSQLAPLLQIGGVILMDEYGYPEWPGETLATDEFLAKNPNFRSEKISNAIQPTLKITRIN